MPAPRDTHPDAHAVQVAIFRRMGGARRAGLGAEMSEQMRVTLGAGVRARHSSYDARDIEYAVRRILLGDELTRRAWPDEPLRDP